MTRTQLNWLLFAVLVVMAGFTLAMGRDPSRPNYEIMPDMAHSVPYDAFAPNPNFPDGKTLQPPVPGTISRDEQPFYYEATPEDALRAGEELLNPFTSEDQDALQRGARVFGIFCAPCHGGAGRGDGLVTQRGFPPPPSFFNEGLLAMKDGQMFHALTHGVRNMPSYAAQISPDDRWKVILHLREMQKREATALAAAPQQITNATATPELVAPEVPAPAPQAAPVPAEPPAPSDVAPATETATAAPEISPASPTSSDVSSATTTGVPQ